MEAIIKTLLLEGIDEVTIHRVLDVIEEEYEAINEISKETADDVSLERHKRYKKAREKFIKDRNGKDAEEMEHALHKEVSNMELRDKWDVSKGIKRGKDGEFHKRF